MIHDRKRRGRPPIEPRAVAPSAAVHLKLVAEDFDRAEQVAKRERESIQDVIRRGLRRLLDNDSRLD